MKYKNPLWTTRGKTFKVDNRLNLAWQYINESKNQLAYKQCVRNWQEGNTWDCWHYLDIDNILFNYKVDFNNPRGLATIIKGPYAAVVDSNKQFYTDLQSGLDPYKEETFCNSNVSTYFYFLDEQEVASLFMSYAANPLHHFLTEEIETIPVKNGIIRQIPYECIEHHLRDKHFVFASLYVDPIGHIAPIGGLYHDTDKNNQFIVKKPFTPYCMNIGASIRDGYNSIKYSFYENNVNKIKYFAYWS